jgi:predicted GNAT family acetyltransferase
MAGRGKDRKVTEKKVAERESHYGNDRRFLSGGGGAGWCFFNLLEGFKTVPVCPY